ncbi:cation:proton antiporter [Sneathiella chinensis]|nr:cation:proton antiporter [Sneathiella chinensis]
MILWVGLTGNAAAAGGELPPLVYDIGVSLFAASILAILFVKIKIPSIAAFLLAGILVGPVGFGLITEPDNIDTIAELGFLLLLFMIGLEIDIRKTFKSGRMIVISGILQYPLSVLFGFAFVKLLVWGGLTVTLTGPFDALYFGIFIAGSSTLLVINLFQQNYELDTEPGRIALGILVFQDIWAIIVIVIQPNFQSPEVLPIFISIAGIIVLSAISYGLAKHLVVHAFRWLSKEPQLVFVGAIGWCFSIVFIGSSLDYLGSMVFDFPTPLSVGSGMSALIAGMTIATLPYSREIVGKVGVVRDFFIILFFVGLGMSIPPVTDFSVIKIAVVLAFIALLTRQLIFFPLFYFTGGDQRHSQVASIRLAQISEFGLVIAYLGAQKGHLSVEFSSAIIFAFVITALLTQPLYRHAYKIHARMAPWLQRLGFREPSAQGDEREGTYDIVLLGFHRVASSLLHEIAINRPEILPRVLVIDFNVQLHPAIRKTGVTVRYGDLSNEETLLHAGISNAKIIIATIPDDILRGTSNLKLVQTVKRLNTEAIVIANAENPATAREIYSSGADYVYMGRVSTARALDELVGQALEGALQDFRKEQEEVHGHHHDRKEILS